jgi:glycosyltransferase involved in cell wall biosynthesis
MKVAWPTEFNASGESFGYSVHNARGRQSLADAGFEIVDVADADVVIQACPAHSFQPVEGKLNILWCAWESPDLLPIQVERAAKADAICVTAKFLVEAFKAALPDARVEYVPLGVDTKQFPFVDRRDKHYAPRGGTPKSRRPYRFMWNGAASGRKGYEVLLKAWEPFSFSQQCELYIKTTAPGISNAVQRHGNVIFDTRKLATDDLARLYQRAHCFVFPSMGEGFGLTMAEAMATGCPVICADTTAMQDLAGSPLAQGQETCFHVPFEVKSIPWSCANIDGTGLAVSARLRWSIIETRDLAEAMISVPGAADSFHRGLRASERIRDSFSWEHCGERLRRVVYSLSI